MLRFLTLSPIPYSSTAREGYIFSIAACFRDHRVLFKIQFIHSQLLEFWTFLWTDIIFISVWKVVVGTLDLYFGDWTIWWECCLSQVVRAERPWLQQQESPGWPWSELALKLSRLTLAKNYFFSHSKTGVCLEALYRPEVLSHDSGSGCFHQINVSSTWALKSCMWFSLCFK